MPNKNHSLKGLRTVIFLFLLFGAGVLAFWISFYTDGSVSLAESDSYLEFEKSFTAADILSALFSVGAALGLLFRKNWALLLGLLAVGGILFLGCMDVSYNLSHDLYSNLDAAMLSECIINIFCFVGGPYILITLWRKRSQVLN